MSAEAKMDPESGRPLVEKGKVAYVADGEAVEVAGQADKFIGLSKDELEEYRNAPFWRNLRYLLFGLFWLAWIAMFAGAIAIVVTSPPCKPKIKPHWWQMKIAYQLMTPSFADSDGDGVGDVPGILEKLPNLDRLSVQTVWPRPLLSSKDGTIEVADVTDFATVDPRYGTNADLDNLIKALHAKDMYFIMDLPFATSTEHDWFTRSKNKEAGYEDLYKWAGRSGASGFWSQDGTRREFYHHVQGQPGHAVLNLASLNARTKFKEVVEMWLDKGVDGVYLHNIDYVARSLDGSKPDWDKAYPILADMDTDLIDYKNRTNDLGNQHLILFTGVDEGVAEDVRANLVTQGKLSYVYAPVLTTLSWEACGNSVGCLREALRKANEHHETYKDTWPLFEVGNSKVSRLATRFGEERATLMEMLLLTLPGAIAHYYGDELPLMDATPKAPYSAQHGAMHWTAGANAGFSSASDLGPPAPTNYTTLNFEVPIFPSVSESRGLVLKELGKGNTLRKLFTRLCGLRQREQTLMDGSFEVVAVDSKGPEGVLITIRRPKPGAKGKIFVTVLNFFEKTLKKLDLTQAGLKPEGEVVAATNAAADKYTARSKADLADISLPPFSPSFPPRTGELEGVVFRYEHVVPPPPEDQAPAEEN